MKIKHLFFTLFAAAAIFTGCDKEVDFGDPSLTISQYTASIPLEGGSVTVKVNATRDWVVRTDADWVIVDPESGKASFDDVTVTITAPANTGVNRTAEIEFYGGKLACESIAVTQEGPDGDKDAAKFVTCADFASMPDDDGTIYCLSGTISGSINTQYGNFDVVDPSGSVYVYGCVNVDEYVDMLKKGNTIVVEGPKTTYNGKPEMKNATILYIQRGQDDGNTGGHDKSVYYNDFDKTAASNTFGTSGNSWPFLDQFDGWQNQVGTGAAGVSYDFNAMSARNNSNSDGSYSDYAGSGTNNLFFGTKAYFVVKDIALGSGADYTLSFGTEKYAYGVDDNTFNHSEFHVYISNDGAKWVELVYAFPSGDKNGRWDKASSTFTLPAGTSKLSVYFASDLASAHRLDDVELVSAASAGTAIDFSKGVDLDGGGTGDDGGGSGSGDVEHGATTVSAFVAAAESTTDWYELTGVISNLKDGDKYGNFDLTDDSGSVYVYGVLTEKGGDKQKFQDLVSKYGITNDGTITIKANRGSYNGKVEAVNAFFVSYKAGEGGEGGEGDDGGSTPVVNPPTDITDVTVEQFLAAAESTTKYYRLTGEVKNITSTVYGNFDLVDASGSVYVYGLTKTFQAYDSANSKWPNDKSFAELGIKAGDTVTIVGTRGSYGDKIEVCGAYCEKVVAGEGGDDGSGDDGSGEGGDATNEFSSSISWILGTNAYDNTSDKNAQTAIINGKEVNNLLKLGTSKAAGDAQLVIPSGTTKIGFYAVGWKGSSGNVLKIGGKNVSVAANAGAQGNPEYTLTVSDNDYYEVEVESGKVSISCDKRVLIFGINAK